MNEKVGKVIGVIIGIPVVIALIYFGMKTQKNHEAKYPWRGAFYKVTEAGSSLTDSSELKTLDECRQWSTDRATYYNYKEGEYDYSCGTGCTYKDDSIVSGKRIKTYTCTEMTQ